MTQSSGQARVVRFFEHVPIAAAAMGLLIAVVTLGQWYMGVGARAAYVPGAVSMLPVTAVIIGLNSIALALSARPGRPVVVRAAAVVVVCIAGIIAVVQLASWIAGRDMGFDLLLFPEELRRAPWDPPGRMAINTVAGVLLSSISILALQVDDRSNGHSARWAALFAGTIGFLGLVGYSFGVSSLYSVREFSGMSITTALSLFVLGIGVIFGRRNSGLPKLLVDPGAAGTVARRLVPAAVFVPFLLGWLRLFGEKNGWYDTPFG
ncbi:MAG: hypothetical protein M3Z30_09115, partial [Gemmatimonadota bacterium]|nr:hypothetical protein [Gemmatimonadota bacterium]